MFDDGKSTEDGLDAVPWNFGSSAELVGHFWVKAGG
jgi:hypothetical protein